MPKIVISNSIEKHWNGVIEARINYMLASVAGHLKTIDVEFTRNVRYRDDDPRHRCKVQVMEYSGVWHIVSNEQVDPSEAIDGAIARVRRSIVRLRQYRLVS